MPLTTGIVSYRTGAASSQEALEQADNWLSMFIDWRAPAPDDYDMETACAHPTGEYDDDGDQIYEISVSVVFGGETPAQLVPLMSTASPDVEYTEDPPCSHCGKFWPDHDPLCN